MAAFSYQQPTFLPDTTFFPNEFIPNFHQFYSSFGTCENNQTPLAHNNHQEGASFDASAHESSCIEQQSVFNDNSLSEKQRIDNLSMADKAESGDQVTQNCAPVDKKRKSRNGSSLNSANSKETKQVKSKKQKGNNKEAMNDKKNDKKDKNKVNEEPPKDYIHVRARRGQATDSHSLAERVRREKISEKMRTLQAIVPGCDKVTGKALMLDEIINYVQSLQNQVEFLSMKLASVDPMIYTFGLMDLDPMIFGADVQGMNNNNMGFPIPLIQSNSGNTSGSSSPTRAFTTANSCLASPATSSTLSPTFPNLHVGNNVSNNLLQHEQKPSFLHLQDVGSSYWGVNEQERQSIINQFGLIGNNLYSSQ